MKIDIEFNRDSFSFNQVNMENNRRYVQYQAMMLKDAAELKGYMYLSQIYEAFGVAWNPHAENLVWIKDENWHIDFEIKDELPERLLITVVWPDN